MRKITVVECSTTREEWTGRRSELRVSGQTLALT